MLLYKSQWRGNSSLHIINQSLILTFTGKLNTLKKLEKIKSFTFTLILISLDQRANTGSKSIIKPIELLLLTLNRFFQLVNDSCKLRYSEQSPLKTLFSIESSYSFVIGPTLSPLVFTLSDSYGQLWK